MFRKPEFGECRSFGHRWRRNGAPVLGDGRVVTVRLVCESCKAERRDEVSLSSGDVVRRKYVLTDGYSWAGLGERPSKAQTRAKFLGHLVKGR